MGCIVTLFLDACVIIYRVECVDPFSTRFSTLVEELTANADHTLIAVSRLSWLECRVRPLRERNDSLLACYERFFAAPGLAWVELSPLVVDAACDLRAEHGLRTPDALHGACCLTLGPGTRSLPGIRSSSEYQVSTSMS